jgi:hypothetical protein
LVEKRHEVLLTQLETYREETLHCVASLTEETADVIPAGFSNNIRWNLGHLYLDQYLWIQHLTKEPTPIPDGFREWFGYGTSPADWLTPPPSLDELKQLLREQPRVIRERYGHRLEEEFPATEMGMHTLEQVLVRTIFHEGMHLASIIALRKFL